MNNKERKEFLVVISFCNKSNVIAVGVIMLISVTSQIHIEVLESVVVNW